ncbi:MAG: sugar phosphate isomerase/epimerase family protein [Bacteroidota bacterium]
MTGLRALPFLLLFCWSLTGQSDASPPRIGIVADLADADILPELGFVALTENTQKILSPLKVTDAEFAVHLAAIKKLRTPLYATNLFIPGELKIVGDEVDEAALLAYVDGVLRRAKAAGLTLITWGSCGSRRVPEGYSREIATAQFIHYARKVARVAAKHDIILALENLNLTECNFLTDVPQALAVVQAVDHPNFRLCVDLYHMRVNGEPASDLVGVGPYAIHCEIAEGDGRTPPGIKGDDFIPYFKVLHEEGYRGMISIEARWEDLGKQGAAAVKTLQNQLRAASGR